MNDGFERTRDRARALRVALSSPASHLFPLPRTLVIARIVKTFLETSHSMFVIRHSSFIIR